LLLFTQFTCVKDKKTLREATPDNSVAHLQEELIAVKLREAEANLSLKDLRQRIGELSAQWQRHLQVMFVAHV
jgi:predicted  nucleic acid-binding Zn-ribbon protein